MKIFNLGNSIVNTYLVENNAKYILIDTGYPNQFDFFRKKMKKTDIALSDIEYVFITHSHDDHIGFLNEFLQYSSAKVIINEKAVEILNSGRNSSDGGCTNRISYIISKLMSLLGQGEHKFPPLKKEFFDRLIVVNDNNIKLLEKELGAKIVSTPGHTKCSISLLFDKGVLFCGDAAMNGFPSKHRISIFAENIAEYCVSWRKIISLQPKLIYPGHGKSFEPQDLEKYIGKAEKAKIFN